MKRFLPTALLLLCFTPFLSLSAQTKNNSQSVSSPTISALPLGQKLQISGLRNAGKIDDSLFRGAQPQLQGIDELKKLGITTIVDLRGDGRDQIERERKRAESLGMHFVN